MKGLRGKTSGESKIDIPFTIRELKRALANTRKSATGICYMIII